MIKKTKPRDKQKIVIGICYAKVALSINLVTYYIDQN